MTNCFRLKKQRYLTLIIAWFLHFSASTQSAFSLHLSDDWLAENVVSMQIKGDSIVLDNQTSIFCIRQNGDTIFATQQQRYLVLDESQNFIEKDTVIGFQFILIEKDSNVLIIKSLDFGAMDFWRVAQTVKGTRQYMFYRKKSVEKTWFDIEKTKFQKLAFWCSGNEEDFSNIQFEILPNQTIYFNVKIDSNAHPQQVYDGCYKGKLTEEIRSKIISLLAESAFYKTSSDWDFITCGSLYQVSMQSPNFFKKCTGGIVPNHCKRLIAYLEQLFFEKTWQPCAKHQFKFLNKKTKEEIRNEKMNKKYRNI